VNDAELQLVLTKALNDKEFLDRIAKRMIKIISSGASEGNETLTNVGEFQFTRFQLDRFKKAFIFLCSNDEEFRVSMRKVFRRYIDRPVGEPLSRAQLTRRIYEFGALAYKHKGRMCGFWSKEIYAAFGEYSRKQVLQMLMDTGLFIRYGVKEHPHTGKNARTLILDV
jgi:hypothetical protein